MFETLVTLDGLIVGEITRRRHAETPSTRFRMQVRERRFDRETEQWRDGDRMFVSVTCRRALADNVAATLARGDRVLVHGRLYAREYDPGGGAVRLSVEVEARTVGPSLAWCAAALDRPRTAAAEEPVEVAA